MADNGKPSIITRTRRNHGLEHATINILSGRHPGMHLAGYSNPFGFTIIGSVTMDDLRNAITEAREKVENGKRNLVIHEHCGTNVVAGGLLAGLSAWLGMLGAKRSYRSQLERLPLVILLACLSLLFSPALGVWLQKNVTTSSEVEKVEVKAITQGRFGKYPRFYIQTRF